MDGTVKRKHGLACGLIVAILAMMFLLVGPVGRAFADDPYPVTDATKVAVTKNFTMNENIHVPAGVFKFTVTPVSVNEDGYDAVTQNMPTFAIADITTAAGATGVVDSTTHTRTVTCTSSNFLPTVGTTLGTNFTHAGVYVYTVVEDVAHSSIGGTTDAGTGETKNYSQASYTIRVYVINGENGLEISETTVEQVQDDKAAATGVKVNPIVPAAGDATSGGFAFGNSYAKVASLGVTKTVTGDYDDLSKKFKFTLTFASEAKGIAIANDSSATSVQADGAAIADTSNFNATSITFEATSAQALKLTNLPVGTIYTVTETLGTNDTAEYTPKATVVYDGGTGVEKAGSKGQTLTVNGDGTGTPAINTTVGEGANSTAVTNDYSAPTPTGILIANLPYILIGLVAAAGIALLVVSRRRRAGRHQA